MSFQINNTTIIDDNRNISSVGVATVGSGASSIILDGTTGNMNVGAGITMEGVSGNISITGTLSASGLNIPPTITAFSPAIGATGVARNTNIDLTFNQWVGIGTTGTVVFREGSPGGIGVNTLTVSAASTISRYQIRFTYSGSDLGGPDTTYYPVFSPELIISDSGQFLGINTGSGPSYSFTTNVIPGDPFGGGTLICQASGTNWVVAPNTSEVSRNWYCRDDAVTTAQSVSGCTGWFVPSVGQLQNPGYTCRTYWDS